MSGFSGMKMSIGKPGTKYGLHRPNAAKAKPVASVFGDADDEVPMAPVGLGCANSLSASRMLVPLAALSSCPC